MGKNETVRSHTVPKMYLKHFANHKGQVWIYSTKDNKQFPQNIRNACVRNKTYEMQDNKIDNILEQILSEHEARWSILLEDIIKGKERLEQCELTDLLFFCFMQLYRTEYSRAKTLDLLKEEKFSQLRDKIPSNINFENIALYKNQPRILHMALSHMVTKVTVYETEKETYITDSPIVYNAPSCIYCPLTSHSFLFIETSPNCTHAHQPAITIKRESPNDEIRAVIHQDAEIVIKGSKFTDEEIESLQQLRTMKNDKKLKGIVTIQCK